MSMADKENILHYFETLLNKPAGEADVEELLDCLSAENAVERIAYRN